MIPGNGADWQVVVTSPENDRIYGWKAIAEYLLRDERTAKRWEKQRGLPVRRIPGDGRANVYVQRSEVEAWLRRDSEWPVRTAGPEEQLAELPPSSTDGETAPESGDRLPGSSTTEPAQAAEATGGEPIKDAVEVSPGDYGFLVAGAASSGFKPSQHVSLIISCLGLVLLLAATAMRFFHVGPLESILFASESVHAPVPVAASLQERDDLYLRALYLCEQRTPATLQEAQQLFERALQLDGSHAGSYSGLAKTYLLEREYATMPDAEAYPKAKRAAEQALLLDPRQAEAHAILGFIDFFWLWQAQDAEREFRAAMEGETRSALAHHWFGSMLMHQGRYPEALEQLAAAQRLEPTSTAILATRALALGFAGDRDAGVRLLESMQRNGIEISVVHRNLSYLSLIEPRDPARFLAEAQRFAAMRQDTQTQAALLTAGEAFRRGGEPAMWRAILEQERSTHAADDRPSYRMAQAEAALGQGGAALEHLARLADERDMRVQGMLVDPTFLPLRNNAEFTHIAERAGLSYPAMARR